MVILLRSPDGMPQGIGVSTKPVNRPADTNVVACYAHGGSGREAADAFPAATGCRAGVEHPMPAAQDMRAGPFGLSRGALFGSPWRRGHGIVPPVSPRRL